MARRGADRTCVRTIGLKMASKFKVKIEVKKMKQLLKLQLQ